MLIPVIRTPSAAGSPTCIIYDDIECTASDARRVGGALWLVFARHGSLLATKFSVEAGSDLESADNLNTALDAPFSSPSQPPFATKQPPQLYTTINHYSIPTTHYPMIFSLAANRSNSLARRESTPNWLQRMVSSSSTSSEEDTESNSLRRVASRHPSVRTTTTTTNDDETYTFTDASGRRRSSTFMHGRPITPKTKPKLEARTSNPEPGFMSSRRSLEPKGKPKLVARPTRVVSNAELEQRLHNQAMRRIKSDAVTEQRFRVSPWFL